MVSAGCTAGDVAELACVVGGTEVGSGEEEGRRLRTVMLFQTSYPSHPPHPLHITYTLICVCVCVCVCDTQICEARGLGRIGHLRTVKRHHMGAISS